LTQEAVGVKIRSIMKVEIEIHSELADNIVVAVLKSTLEDVDFWKDEPKYHKKLKASLKLLLEYYEG